MMSQYQSLLVSDNNSNCSNNNDTIVGVLGYWPTEEEQMWSHLELLDKLPKEESLKMVSKCSSPPFTLSLSSSFPPLSPDIIWLWSFRRCLSWKMEHIIKFTQSKILLERRSYKVLHLLYLVYY